MHKRALSYFITFNLSAMKHKEYEKASSLLDLFHISYVAFTIKINIKAGVTVSNANSTSYVIRLKFLKSLYLYTTVFFISFKQLA